MPRSGFKAFVDLSHLVLYHSAILGVTGSGKSFLAFDLIERCAKAGTKVICCDITGDYRRYLSAVMLEQQGALHAFLDSDNEAIAIMEYESSSKHPTLLKREVIHQVLDWCKSARLASEVGSPVPRVLVVLEEAHTLIPEFNINPDRTNQGHVADTAKAVLQARKYGLGLLVVAQRTANVTKSILNQCNSLFAFQAFDETGFDFMKNYVGSRYVDALPNLQKQQGIVVGKGSLSDRPLIVRFNTQNRQPSNGDLPAMPV